MAEDDAEKPTTSDPGAKKPPFQRWVVKCLLLCGLGFEAVAVFADKIQLGGIGQGIAAFVGMFCLGAAIVPALGWGAWFGGKGAANLMSRGTPNVSEEQGSRPRIPTPGKDLKSLPEEPAPEMDPTRPPLDGKPSTKAPKGEK